MSRDPRTETVTGAASGPDSAANAASIELLAPGSQLGDRWRIERVLGRGGFAVVYLAHDLKLGRAVALKVLRHDRISGASLQRLRREAALARDLAHPNLARVFDIEEAGGSVFLTLEPADGGSLRDRLRAGPLPVEEAIGVATRIFDGLAALHGLGVVHRDVKPGNVLLSSDGRVRLADFGLALHLEGDETRMTATDATVGTLEYLSPEQALGEEIDPRSDLFSAGIVLFEMLTGSPPHGGRSSLGTLVARFRERPPNVRSLRREVPRWLDRLVERLLERRPQDRYGDASAVAADLRRRGTAFRPSQRKLLVASLAAAAAAAVAISFLVEGERRGRSFSHLAIGAGSESVQAVDRRGRVLWERHDVRPVGNFVPFRRAPGDALRLAAILCASDDFALDAARRLVDLDPRSGQELDALDLPDGSSHFGDFSRTYSFTVEAVDLDGDGGDELFVTYEHAPFWPSYTVLVEPRLRRARVIFVASGHHRFSGTVDLDGDGREEVLFAGVNNRLGWNTGVAAIRLPDDLGQPVSGGDGSPAYSIDRNARDLDPHRLVWYALAPRGLLRNSLQPVAIDRQRQRLTVEYGRRDPYELDFDGFPGRGSRETGDAALRLAARARLWAEFTEAERLVEGGEPERALPLFERAEASAAAAGLPLEAEWTGVVRNRARIAAGRFDEAMREMERLVATSERPSEIAFDAARALHRRGANRQALEAYRRAFSLPGFTDGRGEYETFEGILLLLLEEERFDEAGREVERFCRVLSGATPCGVFTQVVRWRRGEPIAPSGLPSADDSYPDLESYWSLELRRAAGASPAALLAEVGAERARSSSTATLLDGLELQLLLDLGRLDEAVPLAARLTAGLEQRIAADPALRAHAELLRARVAPATATGVAR